MLRIATTFAPRLQATTLRSPSKPHTMTTQTPTITASQQRRWNRMGDHMSHFHEGFKREFDSIYELADGSFNTYGMSLSRFLKQASGLTSHLNMHHTIEEQFLFPKLAARMPSFKGEHLKSHKGIHKGLEDLEILIAKYTADSTSYDPVEMRKCLDSFKEVLFRHMDEEVTDLQGENLRKYFTLAEIERIQI